VGRVAARHYLQTLVEVADQAANRLTDPGSDLDLRPAIRRLDGDYQTLVTTLIPLRIPFTNTADSKRERVLQTATAARHYARNLRTDTAVSVQLPPQARHELDQATRLLTVSLGELIAHLQDTDPTPRTYVRAAARFDEVATLLEDSEYLAPPQLALRDFQLLDGTMATLAQSLGLTVHALDTDGPIT
jgi:hypothetical protein